jgi:RND family efflux transporter MFP subunit
MKTCTRTLSQSYRLLILLAALISVLAACSQQEEEAPAPEPVRPVKIIEIRDPVAELKRAFPGVVISAEDTVLSFRVSGRLQDLPVLKQVGAMVEDGDLLAVLDPTDFRNALLAAEASFELAEEQFKRGASLVDEGYVSQTDFERLRARYKSKQAELFQAQTNLGYTELRAPFRGRIARVDSKNFETVRADQSIAVLEVADKIDVEIHVPTAVLSQVSDPVKARFRAGQSGNHNFSIELEKQPGKHYRAVVTEAETRPDPATLSYRTVLSMTAPKNTEVLAGLNARVHVDLAELGDIEPRIYVPVEAVFSAEDVAVQDGVAYVWLIDRDSMAVQRRRITVGPMTPQGVEVRDGLEPGNSIVGAGVHFLAEGTVVRPLVRESGL